MPALDLRGIRPDHKVAAQFVCAALHALGREEVAGRRPMRLTEPDRATWRQFRGRMNDRDLVELVIEDAAVTQPFAFDAPGLLGAEALRIQQLPVDRVTAWLGALADLDLQAPSDEYLADQARRLELASRLARTDLHRGIRPHHRVLELPGSGGQLSKFLADALPDVYLRDVFVIAWSNWRDRMLAGLAAVESGLTGTAPVLPEAGLDGVRERGERFDFVIGARPERDLQPHDRAVLEQWFPGATVVLV